MTADELLEAIEAAGSAGADEQTFGLSSHIAGPEQSKIRNKHPLASILGRVGSYVPGMFAGTGEERLLARGGEGLLQKILANTPQEILNRAVSKGANVVPLLREAKVAGDVATSPVASAITTGLKASGRGAVSAAGAGTANALARSATSQLPGDTGEQEKPLSELPSDALHQAEGGALAGPFFRMLQEAAPSVYRHGALTSPRDVENSKEFADQMLKEGRWGTLKDTFKPYAEQLKDAINVARDKLIPNAMQNEREQTEFVNAIPRPYGPTRGQVDVDSFLQRGKNAARDLQGAGDAARDAMGREFDQTAQDVLRSDEFGNSTVGDLNRSAKNVNTRLKQLTSPADKGKLYGDVEGPLSQEKQRLEALKQAHSDSIDEAIDQFGNTAEQNKAANPNNPEEWKSDIEKLDDAKDTYGKGAALEGNMRDYERGEMGGKFHSPHNLGHTILDNSVNAPIVRTGLGVLLSRLSPEKVGMTVGRATDYRQKGALNAPKAQDVDELLKQYQQEPSSPPNSAPEEDPYEAALKNPTKDVKNTSGDPYLDALKGN